MGFESNTGTGSVAHYGPRETNQSFGGTSTNRSGEIQAVYQFDFDELPEATNIDLDNIIPSGAQILSAEFNVITAFTSTSTTSDLLVGLADADGGATITDADGLLTAAQLTQTVIGTTVVTSGTGALVGTTLTEAAVVTVAPSVDDLLTGRANLVVTYRPANTGTYTAPTGT